MGQLLINKVFFLILTVSIQFNFAFAEKYEYYTDRPNILELEARQSKNEEWKKLNWAQLEFIAQLLGLYPTQKLYFLARDGEYLYDLALVLTEENPELRKRLHLINVSRSNQYNSKLKKYLEQNGLTHSRIEKYGVVFVDTGFSGSIANRIKELYNTKTSDRMLTHLIESNVDSIPQSEVFKSQNAMDAGSYEEMARYFDRSTNFKLVKNKLVPVSPKGESESYNSDGLVDKAEALKYMQTALAMGRTKKARELFYKRLEQWSYLSNLIHQGNQNIMQIVDILSRISKGWHSPVAEAMIKDFVNYYNISSGRLIILGDISFSGTKKPNFDIPSMLTKFDSQLYNGLLKMTKMDLVDLSLVLQLAYEKSDFYSIKETMNQMRDKDLESLLRQTRESMTNSEFEKLFLQLIRHMGGRVEPIWYKLYKKLNINNDLIKKELDQSIAYIYSEYEARSCRRAIGS